MNLNFDTEQLYHLLKNFYKVTGVRTGVYDGDHVKIMTYPKRHCDFCQLMHDYPMAYQNCKESNKKAFIQCKELNDIIIYTCHAGLTEVVAPLKDDGVVIGYMNFGQLTNVKDIDKLNDRILESCKKYEIDKTDHSRLLSQINYKTSEEIVAMSNILEACACYIATKDIIRLSRDNFLSRLDEYIMQHMSKKITIDDICREFATSKTKLYTLINDSLNMSIGQYIRSKRLSCAKELLTNDELTIAEIADMTGFSEYNYFCSTFKKEIGVTALQYRKNLK